jgi:hypothetical protein
MRADSALMTDVKPTAVELRIRQGGVRWQR